MDKLFQVVENFFAGEGIWVYLCIFFGRLLDVSAATIRIVLVNRGEKLVGSIVAFLEITVWLFVARSVLNTDASALKIIIYSIAFALGTYLGSVIEEKLAFGLSQVQIVLTDRESAVTLKKELHDAGFGVTSLDVHGTEEDARYMLIVFVRRKMLPEVSRIVNKTCANAVVTISDVKSQKGGYMRSLVRHK